MDAEVLICGLGPVGQVLAHLLGALGIRTIAVDGADGPSDLPRAAVIDDEVLRILQALGLDEEVLRDAQVQTGVSYVTADGRAVELLRTGVGALGQPPLVSIHQPSLERTLVAALPGRETVEVRWGQRLECVEQNAEGVHATLRSERDGAPSTVAARFAVGCDGAASTVRRGLGIEFGGSTFAQRWLVVDAKVDAPLTRVPHPYFVGHAAGPIVTLPMSPGRHRWEWMARPGEDEAALLDPKTIRRRMEEWLAGETAELERAIVYTFHARIAGRWRQERVLLAGDAAHVMPPFAGQGLSSGVRDASNLAWKLDAVLRGAPATLLDTYEEERRPHVTAMQNLAVRWGAVVQTGRPRLAWARDRLMDALDDTALQRWLQGNVKPAPTYRTGAFASRPNRLPPLRGVGSLFPQPTVERPGGERLRLDDALPEGWVALAVDVEVANVLRSSGLAVVELGTDVDDAAGVLRAWLRRHRASWVLLRPDRYVFACGRGDGIAPSLTAMRQHLGVVGTERTRRVGAPG